MDSTADLQAGHRGAMARSTLAAVCAPLSPVLLRNHASMRPLDFHLSACHVRRLQPTPWLAIYVMVGCASRRLWAYCGSEDRAFAPLLHHRALRHALI